MPRSRTAWSRISARLIDRMLGHVPGMLRDSPTLHCSEHAGGRRYGGLVPGLFRPSDTGSSRVWPMSGTCFWGSEPRRATGTQFGIREQHRSPEGTHWADVPRLYTEHRPTVHVVWLREFGARWPAIYVLRNPSSVLRTRVQGKRARTRENRRVAPLKLENSIFDAHGAMERIAHAKIVN